MAKSDVGPVTLVSWQAEVNAVLPSPQAIEAYERIGGAFRARKGS